MSFKDCINVTTPQVGARSLVRPPGRKRGAGRLWPTGLVLATCGLGRITRHHGLRVWGCSVSWLIRAEGRIIGPCPQGPVLRSVLVPSGFMGKWTEGPSALGLRNWNRTSVKTWSLAGQRAQNLWSRVRSRQLSCCLWGCRLSRGKVRSWSGFYYIYIYWEGWLLELGFKAKFSQSRKNPLFQLSHLPRTLLWASWLQQAPPLLFQFLVCFRHGACGTYWIYFHFFLSPQLEPNRVRYFVLYTSVSLGSRTVWGISKCSINILWIIKDE